jgi:hypothetical protein
MGLIVNQNSEDSEDLKQAKAFLNSLPESCANSSLVMRDDGSVLIEIISDDLPELSGRKMMIKHGIVTELE